MRIPRTVKFLTVGLALAATAACASLSSPTPQKQVYAAGQSLAILGQLVTAYDKLPDCTQGQLTACSTPVMRQNLAKALVVAVNEYLAAQKASQAGQPVDTTILTEALGTLQSLVSSIPTKD